ncbi:hypothetical protein HK101_001544 [Irineochytrium annulatum]|nr:hypothetical protein HK101_001544 [Irineochytrium annulatum]
MMQSAHHAHDGGYPSSNGARLGYKLHDFQLLKTLGTGTFGRVYLSRFKNSDQYYAMKVLKKSEVVRLKQVEHINSEKQILSQIQFPFIVNLLCTFQDDRNVFMLLEYVVGGELFSHLRRAGRFSNDMTRFYASEIVLAIEYLHRLDIIYRDLKPENLLLDGKGHVKITDFGFAKKVEDRTWTLCGTPEYLAPEIIQSKGHGKAVDWWALGILIFEMLAGYPPFFDDNPFGIYEKILAGKIVFPSHFDSHAKDLIKKLLTADRTKRLGNLKAGAEDIKKHKWFRGVDWQGLLNRSVNAPIVPVCAHPGDTRNFESYPETDESFGGSRDQKGDIDPFKTFFKVGHVVCRPIVYGSSAYTIGKKDPPPVDPSHTHRWTVYLRGHNGEDISFFIKKVSFKLHESFPNHVRVIEKPPFEVTETGWGEFEIVIKVSFVEPAQEKQLQLFHHLQLYHKDDNPMGKRFVVSERYEELVFNEPTEELYEIFQNHPVDDQIQMEAPEGGHQFTPEAEAAELQKYTEMNDAILREIESHRVRLRRAEEMARKTQSELHALEVE